MRFDIITIFPKVFDSYFHESILKRAQGRGLVAVEAHNLRNYSDDRKHRKVDDAPYGGGPGMVLQVAPIYRATEALLRHFEQVFGLPQAKAKRIEGSSGKKKSLRTRIILFSAKGKQFTQADARRYAKRYDRLIMICGRYEGVDERVAKYIADEEISVGPYILTGGEIPAMVVIDAVSRHIPSVLGKPGSLEEKRIPSSKARSSKLEARNARVASYPVYTRPEVFSPKKGTHWRVPRALLSGDHRGVAEWRKKAIAHTQ